VSFLAMGANIDENVGQLDRFLESQDLKDNTIVVFLTDNGSTMGPDYYNAGMKGKKTTLWEGGHRVPCLIRWPNGRLEPRDIPELSHVQDLLPTLADLAGVQEYLPTQLDGASLAPVLLGEQETLGDRMLVINYSRMPQFKVTFTKGNPAIPQREGAGVLWKHWRLLEDRELYNVAQDPHQDQDVASQHPDVVAKMRQHLDRWWDGVKDTVLEPQRVIIGSDQENPQMLTACEWLDVFVDQQIQVRRGVKKNGVWHLDVAQAGEYEFELRRWPRESGLRLTEACPQEKMTDGTYVAGQAFPIVEARFQIGDFDTMRFPERDGQSFRIKTKLQPGPVELQTWLLDHDDTEICGAYYVYIRRL